MKVLADSFFHKHVIENNFRDAQVLNLPLLEIESLCRNNESKAEDPFVNCCLLVLSNNRIDESCFNSIWVDFPSCWWISLSNNRIGNLSSITFPLAISLLDLSNNPLPKSDLCYLSLCHILRFHLSLENVPSINAALDKTWDALLSINHHMHLVWTFNNHFISHQDRTFVLDTYPPESSYHEEIKQSQRGAWSSLAVSIRQTTVINATHHLERIDHISDTVRLDILFEDYMHECLVWNNFCHAVSVCNSVANKNLKKKPLISNINAILFAPHRQRLDLSVLLTVRLMYSIPDPLFHDALIILIGEYISPSDIESLLSLPPFALTALISLIRRVSLLESQDIRQGQKSRLQVLQIDPSVKSKYSPTFIPTFDSSEGYQFLRDAQRYIKFRFQTTEDDVHQKKLIPFSELEDEIMKQLPDIPTKWCGFVSVFQNEKDAKLLRWVPFACRHAIFILNKAPSCPPLNGVCRNAKDQEFYLEMLPLLKAANMSLVDLDIVTMSPQVDGRAINNLSRTANLSGVVDIHNSNNNMSNHRRRLEQAMKLLEGKILPFGMGLPNASVSSLRWKANEEEIARPYQKPWQANTRFETGDGKPPENNEDNYQNTEALEDASAVGSTFFMTGDVVMQQYDSLGRQSPTQNTANSRKHPPRSNNYLDNYDNPLANRPPPIIMETGKEIYKLDENYLQFSNSSPPSSFRPLSPARLDNDNKQTITSLPSNSIDNSGINKGPSYVIQEVNLDYSKPPSRAITPGTWNANRPPSSSQENRSGSANIPVRTPFTTIFPAMPTNFEEMKQAVAQGGVLESDSYDFHASVNNGVEIVPTHELFPPEFHPHSRAPSMNTFNSRINQVLSVMSASSPGSSGLSRPLSVFDNNNNSRQLSAKPQTRQGNMMDSLSEGQADVDASNNLTLRSMDEQPPLLESEDGNIPFGDGASVKSLVSISLPSVDGARGRSNVLSRGNKSGATSPLIGDNAEQIAVPMFDQFASAPTLHPTDMTMNKAEQMINQRPPLPSSPNKSLHTVKVFSADHMWNPQFVVAPDVAIDSFNKHFQLFQYLSNDRNPASFEHQYWKALNQPQVVMLPPAGKNPTLDPQFLTRTSSPPRTVFLHSLEYPPNPIVKSSPRSPRQRSSSRAPSPTNSTQVNKLSTQPTSSGKESNRSFFADKTELDQDGNLIYDDELRSARKPFSGNNNIHDGKPILEDFNVATARSLTLSDATPSIRGLTASLSDDFGKPIPFSATATPFTATSAFPAGGVLPRKKSSKPTTAGQNRVTPAAFQVNAAEIQQAREELLRDMGTLRNTRELQSFNDHIHSLRMSSDGHIFKVPATSNLSNTGNEHTNTTAATDCSVSEVMSQVGLDMNLVNEMLLTQRPKLSLLVKPLGLEHQHVSNYPYVEETNNNNHNEMVFFTEAPGQYAENDNTQEENEDARLAEEEAYYNQYRHAYQRNQSFNSGDPNSLVTSDVTYGDGDGASFQIEGYDFTMRGETTNTNNNNNNNDIYFVNNEVTMNVTEDGDIGVIKTPSERIREETRANSTLLGMNVMNRDLSHQEVTPSRLHDTIRLVRTTAEDAHKLTNAPMDTVHKNIFSEETYIDQANSQPTISGAKISSSFYPVYPKVVYRVSAEDALAAVYHQQLQSSLSPPGKSPPTTTFRDDIPHQQDMNTNHKSLSSPKHAPVSSSRPTSSSSQNNHPQVRTTLRPITPVLLQNSTLTPADSLSVASMSQHSLLMMPTEPQEHHYPEDTYDDTPATVDTEQLIAAQNLQVLQGSHHFKHLLGNQKAIGKAAASSKITKLLSSTGPGAMLDSYMNYLGPYDYSQSHHAMINPSYDTQGDEGMVDGPYQSVVGDRKTMVFQDSSIAFSSAMGNGPPSVQTNSFSEVVEGVRGSIVEGDFVAPPPEILLESSQVPPSSHQGINNSSSNNSVAVLSLNLQPHHSGRHRHSGQQPDDIDTFSVASAATATSATSAASSHSSGLNEQGSHLIYRAYSAQMVSQQNPHRPQDTVDVAVIGENMPILQSPSRHHPMHSNSNNPENTSSMSIRRRSNSPTLQQHLKKVVISKAVSPQQRDTPVSPDDATQQRRMMMSLFQQGATTMMSETSQASGMLMNLSLSNGSLGSLVHGNDGIGLSSAAAVVDRDRLLSASLSALPTTKPPQSHHHHLHRRMSMDKQKSNASLLLGSQSSLSSSSLSPSLMILAPKSAETLLRLQIQQQKQQPQQQQQQTPSSNAKRQNVSSRSMAPHSQSAKVLSTTAPSLSRPSSGQVLLPPLKHQLPVTHQQQQQQVDATAAAAAIVKPHRRLRSISGRDDPQTHRVWVGKHAYKAATAKVTVDPSFRGATHAAYDKRLQEQRHWQQQQQQVSSPTNGDTGRPVMTLTDMLPQSN